MYLETPTESLVFDNKGIKLIEEKYNCKYVGDFHLERLDTMDISFPVAVFYQETPPNPNYSHYMAMFWAPDGHLYITSGADCFKKPVIAAVADNGQIIYSRHRHDYRTSDDESVSIDGGQSYVRGHYKKLVHLIPEKEKLKVVEAE